MSLVEPFATITSGDLLLSNRAISKKILLLTGTPGSVSGCRLDISLDLVVSLLETHARQSTGKGKLSLFTFGQRVFFIAHRFEIFPAFALFTLELLQMLLEQQSNQISQNPIRQILPKSLTNHTEMKKCTRVSS